MRSLNVFKILPVLLLAGLLQTNASAQPTGNRLDDMLKSYYSLKNALVEGKHDLAAKDALSFTKNLNGISYQLISEGNVDALEKDASLIANAKDLNTQRKVFANLSSNMVKVAKALKLSENTVYVQFCPMKKAYWLSDSSAIRNPYYGSAMLTCGEVKETY